MTLTCSHVVLFTTDLNRAKDFYLGQLGFPVIEDHPHLFAFRAGNVRFSVFKGGRVLEQDSEEPISHSIMFRTENLVETVEELKAKGVVFSGEITDDEAFMEHIALFDPDNNQIYIAQYKRDPLMPA